MMTMQNVALGSAGMASPVHSGYPVYLHMGGGDGWELSIVKWLRRDLVMEIQLRIAWRSAVSNSVFGHRNEKAMWIPFVGVPTITTNGKYNICKSHRGQDTKPQNFGRHDSVALFFFRSGSFFKQIICSGEFRNAIRHVLHTTRGVLPSRD